MSEVPILQVCPEKWKVLDLYLADRYDEEVYLASEIDAVPADTPPIDGRWYWVSSDEKEWWPAKRDTARAGGWTNDDTWEDFDGEVKHWRVILPPPSST